MYFSLKALLEPYIFLRCIFGFKCGNLIHFYSSKFCIFWLFVLVPCGLYFEAVGLKHKNLIKHEQKQFIDALMIAFFIGMTSWALKLKISHRFSCLGTIQFMKHKSAYYFKPPRLCMSWTILAVVLSDVWWDSNRFPRDLVKLCHFSLIVLLESIKLY